MNNKAASIMQHKLTTSCHLILLGLLVVASAAPQGPIASGNEAVTTTVQPPTTTTTSSSPQSAPISQQTSTTTTPPTPAPTTSTTTDIATTTATSILAQTTTIPSIVVQPTTTTTTTVAPTTQTPTQTAPTLVMPAAITEPIIEPKSANNNLASATSTTAAPVVVEPKKQEPIAGIKQIIDLSWPLNDQSLHWPGNTGFKYNVQIDGSQTDASGKDYHIKSDGFGTAVHTATHIDSPRHFAKDGWTIDKIPLERLVDVPVTVIDLSNRITGFNRSYEFTLHDFMDDKTGHSRVLPNSVVLVYTGISQLYDQGAKAYFGTDTKNISEMQIPGFSKEAAEHMVERGVYGVGLDSASADSSNNHGPDNTYNPVAHTILNKANIYILENVSNRLAEMVRTNSSMRLVIAPLPITDGSGSPVRLIAMTLHSDFVKNFAPTLIISPYFVTTMALLYVIIQTFLLK